MDWQQTGALLIVATTVLAFAWVRIRRHRVNSSHCGCGGKTSNETPPGTVLRGRKGERPQLIVKLK